MPKPTKAQLMSAIECHLGEVYGDERPNFCWDIELYMSAGLLPEDYKWPKEDELNQTVYRHRKDLQEAREALALLLDQTRSVLGSKPVRAMDEAISAAEIILAKPITPINLPIEETCGFKHRLILDIQADTTDGCIALASSWIDLAKADPAYTGLMGKGTVNPIRLVREDDDEDETDE